VTTLRRWLAYWTEVKRVLVDPETGERYVKQTCCCCKGPGATRRECAEKSGNKTPCRCDCHSKK
jgi:hypothetical protein